MLLNYYLYSYHTGRKRNLLLCFKAINKKFENYYKNNFYGNIFFSELSLLSYHLLIEEKNTSTEFISQISDETMAKLKTDLENSPIHKKLLEHSVKLFNPNYTTTYLNWDPYFSSESQVKENFQ